ncbi:MAG: carbohydrate binding family 9 domain-containing protein [Lewinellaceae bacterium]|nr:carbohydrate binding family 9 domain-containing protein [Lewinellaceae bacterium]
MSVTVIHDAIQIDGDLAEPIWQTADSATNFLMKWPRDGGPAPAQTTVYCAADDRFVYFAFRCRQDGPLVIQSLKRDAGYWDSDGVAIILDPTNTANSGYFFGINASGVQTDALLSSGSDDEDTNWDNTWLSESKIYANEWTAEIAIPLRILRYNAGENTWGVNFIRNDLANGIYSTWANIPFQFTAIDLGWTGALQWPEAPRRVKGNLNLIPYATTALSRNYEDDTDWEVKPGLGMDAKIGVGSGLNLDLTINPDFSQIEIDEQVVNLTRFDVMLPEKRTFFLENADLFANFGIPPIRPFFSRRIGLSDDGESIPILAGARITGNLNADTRVGLMTMQTSAKNGEPARNYSAFAGRHRLFGRSNIGGYFLNRESFSEGARQSDAYRRNGGAEFTFTSTDGRWNAWSAYHHAFTPGVKKQNGWGNAGWMYSGRKLTFLWDMIKMGVNYQADMGFERRIENYDIVRDTTLRIGYYFLYNNTKYRVFPKSTGSMINFTELEAEFFQVLNPDGTLNESSNYAGITWNLRNTSEFTMRAYVNWANVPVAFKFDDGDLADCPALAAGTYRFQFGEMKWSSNYRKKFFLSFKGGGGGFYTGNQAYMSVELNYRIQPILNLRLSAAYNLLEFPTPYCDVEIFNITPRIEVFFAKNIWWTTFLQYNTQADNFNINSRLQWRFRPMSDIFLVYTDNYAVQFFGPKNRALVLKANYWW